MAPWLLLWDYWQAAYLHVRQWSPWIAGFPHPFSPRQGKMPDLLRRKAEILVIDELLCPIRQALLEGGGRGG